MADHRGSDKFHPFCNLPKYKAECKCGNDYRANCSCSWGNPFQAHHLIGIATLGSTVYSYGKIQPVLKQTTWCTNEAVNIFAMPIWPHTVRYYCGFTRYKLGNIFKYGKLRRLRGSGPGFKDIPQHNIDHDLYDEEVSGILKEQRVTWSVAKKDHEITAQQIADELRTLSGDNQTKLKNRGRGTHQAWVAAIKAGKLGEEAADWYMPFSMAAEPRERAFPIKDDEDTVTDWIKKIWFAIRDS